MRRIIPVFLLFGLGVLASFLVTGVTAQGSDSTLVNLTRVSPTTLDPHWLYDSASAHVATQIYERLVQRRGPSDGEWAPMLATGWDISAAADMYTFTIRSGVTFHAGGTLEAHDVAYSFQRGLLQNRTGGPMWLWFEMFFGNYGIDDLSGDDLAKCQAVQNAITYNDTAGTVTFHLNQGHGGFLALLETPAASILDKEWLAANGGWDGSCSTWRTYHDPAVDASPLYDQANGTGPFQLASWSGDELQLDRYAGYWRQTPAWAGRLARRRWIPSSSVRKPMGARAAMRCSPARLTLRMFRPPISPNSRRMCGASTRATRIVPPI
jgi:peptide/nickel transport system substrate-binding protein